MTDYLQIAEEYFQRGWKPLPVPFRSKNPNFSGWQNLNLAKNDLPKYFNCKPQNIGVLLGATSNGLTDVDLDSPESVKIADYFLPQTKAVFGRAGKLRSHRLYYCDNGKFEKFNNPFLVSSNDERERKQACIVELRTGNGKQTVFPPSTHESGEIVEWQNNGEPLQIAYEDLHRAVSCLASACLISKFWRNGIRNDLTLALSGALLRNGFDLADTKNFIRAVGVAANDEEIADRLKTVEATAQKLDSGEKVYGFPKLAELTDQKLVETVCKWLKIEKSNQINDGQRESSSTLKKPSNFTFSTLDELLSEPEEKHSYVWENILILGGISICSAKPKVGKSTLARNLAVAISQGADFLGRATEKGKIIYLCLEEKRAEIAKHFKSMGASGQDILVHTGKTPEDILPALKYAIAEIEPVLIIIDPLSRVLRVNDFNDYATMARGFEPFIDLAREFNVHILALHHDGKGGREGNDSILGSTAIFGAVDCHLNLKKRETGRTVSTTQRYGIDLPETVIELDTETGLILEKGDLQSFILQEKKDEVLELIGENERIEEKEIKERVGGSSKGIISKAIRALLEEQKLFRTGEGKRNQPYLYSKNRVNENEKPTINADEIEVKDEIQDSGFVGFSYTKNLENLEKLDSEKCSNCGLKLELIGEGMVLFCPMGCGSKNVN